MAGDSKDLSLTKIQGWRCRAGGEVSRSGEAAEGKAA